MLSVPRTASDAEIKAAYRQALLAAHPDKHTTGVRCGAQSIHTTIALIKDAYITLLSSTLRAQHNSLLKEKLASSGPRPAQVISLEEFDEETSDGKAAWRYACRCGGKYRIFEEEMEIGHHLVSCDSCSEVVWVGYESVEEVEQESGENIHD